MNYKAAIASFALFVGVLFSLMLFGHDKDENNARAQQGASQANEPPDTIGGAIREPVGKTYEPSREGDTSDGGKFAAGEEYDDGFRRSVEIKTACNGGIPASRGDLEVSRPDCSDCRQFPDWEGVCNLDDNIMVKVDADCKPWSNKDNAKECGFLVECDDIEIKKSEKICYYNSYKCFSLTNEGQCIVDRTDVPAQFKNPTYYKPNIQNPDNEISIVDGCKIWDGEDGDRYCGIEEICNQTTMDKKCYFDVSKCSLGFKNGRCYSWRDDLDASGNSQDRL